MLHFGFTFQALGGKNEIQLLANNEVEANRLAGAAIDEVRRIERKFSRYLPDSIISRINSSAGKTRVKVDQETAALLNYADTCFHQSDAFFDITTGVLRKCWKFDSGTLPSPEEISKLLGLIGWEKVAWNSSEIYLPTIGMEIDFGGFGKEYAADRANQILHQLGVDNALVNLGGDIRVCGLRQDGSPWIIGVPRTRTINDLLARIAISAGAIATSGDYERYMEINGKRYCHILNPKTGWPVNGFQAVSVVGPSCLAAGTIATTAMLLGEAAGLELLRSAGTQFLCVGKDGAIIQGGAEWELTVARSPQRISE